MTIVASGGYNLSLLVPAEDRATVLRLWARNLPTAPAERFTWLYEQGPASGWLIHDESGRAVGATGLMERRIYCDGAEARCGQAIDLNVDVEHRTVGPALKLQRAVATTAGERGLRLLFGFPNSNSDPVQARIGYKPLGTFGRWVKPLRSARFVRQYVRTPLIAAAASGLVDLGLRIGTRKSLARPPHGAQFTVVDWFDERFDELWLRARNLHRFVGERSADYLNWRFADAPRLQHQGLVLSDASGRATAYLVYCRLGEQVQIGDLLAADPFAIEPLLAEFIRRMRRERAESIAMNFLGPQSFGDLLGRLGFQDRASAWRVLLYAPTETKSSDTPLLNPANWWLTRADVDTDG